MKLYNIIILMLTGFIFYSCTASQTGPDLRISIEELKEKVNRNSFKLSSLHSYGTISIDTPEESNTGSIAVSLYKPDSVFTKISGPFGISVASILITRQNFIYYNIMENYVIKGSSTPLNIGAILKVSMGFDDILNAFSGAFIIGDVSSPGSSLKADEGNYLLTVTEGTDEKRYWIDPETFSVKKYAIYNKTTNRNTLTIDYTDFTQSGSIHFPRKIEVSKPAEKQHVYLDYSTYDFNNNKLDFKLVIPKSAKVTEWD